MNYDFEINERPSKEWTTDKLRKYVSWASSVVNKRLLEYKAQVDIGAIEESKLLEREIDRLQNILGKSTKKNWFFGVGYEKRRKKELLFKARSLYQFTKWDMYTPQAMRELEDKYEKAYKQFNLLYAEYGSSLSREDYSELVTIFGVIGDEILTQFGSDTVANIYSTASESKKHNLLSYMLDIYNESKGKGWTSEELADRLAEKLKEDNDNEEEEKV